MRRVPRVRRLVPLVLLTLLGGLLLTGCRSEPGVAAYVGDRRYPESQIDTIVDEIRDQVEPGDLGRVRSDVVSWLVLRDLGRRVAKERGVAVPPTDYEGLAQVVRLPVDEARTRVYAEWVTVGSALVTEVPAVQPTDDDLRDIYDALVEQQQLPPGVPFDAVVDQINTERSGKLIGLRDVLASAAGRYQVTINPRYGPLRVALDQVPLTLSARSGAASAPRS